MEKTEERNCCLWYESYGKKSVVCGMNHVEKNRGKICCLWYESYGKNCCLWYESYGKTTEEKKLLFVV